MKRFFGLHSSIFLLRFSICHVLFSGFFLIETALAQLGDPKIVVSNPVHQFGKVKEGATVEATFDVKNDGVAPLEIQRLLPACGCTIVEADKKTLQPGEATQFHAKFDTRGFFGEKSKSIRVYSNDPKSASMLLTLKGEIEREFTVTPPKVFFGDVLRGETPSLSFNITAPGVKFYDIATRSEAIDVFHEDSPVDGGKIVTVRLKPEAPLGILRTTVTVKTSSPNEPVVAIPVFAKVQGDLQFNPSYISFDLLEAPLAGPVSRQVELKNIAGDEPKIISITSSNPVVSGSVTEIKRGKLFEVTATIQEGATGVIRAQLTLVTDRAEEGRKNVVLPVYAVITQKGN